MDGVRRRRAENGADAEVVFDRLHVSEMEDIAVADVVVESGVLRIEKAFCEDGFGLRKLPVDTVGRDVEEEAFRVRSADGLEALFGRASGIRVEERREIVGARVSHPDDVVLLRAVEFEDAEIWFAPMDAVVAFCIACDIHMGRHAGHVPRHAAVVHHVFRAILDDGVVAADVAFPWGVVDDGDFAEDRMMQRQFRPAGHLRDVLHVPKKFALCMCGCHSRSDDDGKEKLLEGDVHDLSVIVCLDVFFEGAFLFVDRVRSDVHV